MGKKGKILSDQISKFSYFFLHHTLNFRSVCCVIASVASPQWTDPHVDSKCLSCRHSFQSSPKIRMTLVNFTLTMQICLHSPRGNNRIRLCHANYVLVLARIAAQRVEAAPITVTQGRRPFSAERAPAGAVTDAPRGRKIGFCLHFTT